MHDRNDDDNKEESEYRFSDDEAGYDAEHHEEVHASESSMSTRFVGKGAGMKRMLIGSVVVIVLIGIVYKFVAPTTTLPSTDIVDSTPIQKSAPVQATMPVATSQAAQPVQAIIQAPVQPAAQIPVAPPMGLPAPGSPTQAALPPAQVPQVADNQLNAPVMPTTMPDVIPMQSAAPSQNTMQVSAMGTMPMPATANAKIASLEAQSAQLMTQLQEVYTQKLSDFANQNKALQDQVQALNSRVADLETELKQMVQVLTQQQRANQQPTEKGASEVAPAQPLPPAAESTLNYNVQAIIPGRAWLRAQNGETVTVAEGDVIHDLGRITKIDPYDGVVEINTGNKVVSLSYGNSG